jgi:uncharacterized protein
MASAQSPKSKIMSAVEMRPIKSVAAERWRNGGGVTRTLAAEGERWRISLAEVERNGPYSRFVGISRLSLVLRGSGVTLQNADSIVSLRTFSAVEYDGDTDWNATLIDGPVTALNVMTMKGRYRVRVRVICEPLIVPAGCVAAVVALHGGCTWSAQTAAGNEVHEIRADSYLIANKLNFPIQFSPNATSVNTMERAQMPVLVTIEAANTHLIV